MTTDPTISPDGQWRWDGSNWVPNSQPPATPPAAPAGDATTTDATPPADTTTTTTTTASTTASTSPAAAVGDVVRFAEDDGDEAPTNRALVVDTVEESRDGNGNLLRAGGVYVVPLPEPVFVPTTQLRD